MEIKVGKVQTSRDPTASSQDALLSRNEQMKGDTTNFH